MEKAPKQNENTLVDKALGKDTVMPRKKKVKDGVPDNVAKQEARAEELQKQLAAGEPLSADIPNADDSEDNTENASSDASDNATDGQTTVTPVQPAKQFDRVDPGSVQVAAPVPAAGHELVTLQNRFDVLEGKYNSEMARMTTALQSSQNIINQQEALIASLQAGGGKVADQPSDFAELNPDDYSSYGSEMEQMAATFNKLIKEKARLKTAGASNSGTQGENDRIAKVEATVKNLSGTVQMSAKQAYYAALDTAIVDASNRPEWERINHDPKFAAWLGQDEPLTGIPRKAILLKANQEMNAERVISVFKEFKRSLQGRAMPSSNASESGLAQQAVPGSAAGADIDENTANNKKDLVSTEMFKKAQTDFVQGRITEPAFDKISNDYQRSIAKGWIQR